MKRAKNPALGGTSEPAWQIHLLDRMPDRLHTPPMTRKFRFYRSGLAALAAGCIFTLTTRASTPDTEKRVDQLLSQLTPEEKLSLLGGVNGFYTKDIASINLPRLKMSDGPVGARNDGPSTAYPAGALLAATWDPVIAEKEGEALGRDGRARGDHFLLGPGVNIYRVPQNGRNFEYLGEDPFLAAALAPAYIEGVQSQGVSACVKHYACNNQETHREGIDTLVDERAMQEIYLPAFEAAVKIGHVRSIMASYNRINGDYATANKYLMTDVLRGQWGFDGIAMSDWGATHDTLGPANAGLDLEMPAGDFLNAEKLSPLIADGKVSQATIDDKVKRLLRVAIEMKWMDRPQKDPNIPKDDPTSNTVALAVAREGIVLLKNSGNLLPLDRSKIHSIALLGPGADTYLAGGGSSYTRPTHAVTLLDGLTAAAPGVKINDIPYKDWRGGSLAPLAKASVFEPIDGKPGLSATFFNTADLTGAPVTQRTDTAIDFDWKKKLPTQEVTSHDFSARWTGTIKPAKAGPYIFVVRSDDGSRVKLDGKVIVDNWQDQATHTESASVPLEADHTYQLTVEYYNVGGTANMQFAYLPDLPLISPEEKSVVTAADAAVVCIHVNESEGVDRAYALSPERVRLIQETSAINPHTIVILESGGNVAMKDWIDGVPALIDAYFPGQAGGTALAEILFGDTNPGGHLADTFEKDFPDSPAFGHYPGEDGKTEKVQYTEGIYVGYRWYDKKKIEPRFPFGFGMSYTTFEMKNLKSVPLGDQIGYSIDVTNTGKVAGATVAQLYVRPSANGPIDRPVQQLKGFARVDLKPGETKTVSFPLNARAFSYWDVTSHSWKDLPGEYGIAVGQSSRDIAQTATMHWK
jgi:beta-glucosidase